MSGDPTIFDNVTGAPISDPSKRLKSLAGRAIEVSKCTPAVPWVYFADVQSSEHLMRNTPDGAELTPVYRVRNPHYQLGEPD